MNRLNLSLETPQEDGNELPPDCSVKLFQGKGTAAGKLVVVASDRGTGSFVTDKVEEIASDIREKMQIEPDNLIFIEHRPKKRNFEETFDLVHLQFHCASGRYVKPHWSEFSESATAAIKGDEIL